MMISTSGAYRQGRRDGRGVWMDNERMADVTRHQAFKPIIDVKARMVDFVRKAASLSDKAAMPTP
jgi:4-hydroxyphenylacetate 3-monooxygenase